MNLQNNMLKFKKQHLCMVVIKKVETFCDINFVTYTQSTFHCQHKFKKLALIFGIKFHISNCRNADSRVIAIVTSYNQICGSCKPTKALGFFFHTK